MTKDQEPSTRETEILENASRDEWRIFFLDSRSLESTLNRGGTLKNLVIYL